MSDWRPMVDRLYEIIDAYKIEPPPLPTADIAEAIAFLEWLADNNFTFLGVRDYAYAGGARRGALRREKKKGLGILADPRVRVLSRGGHGVITTPAIREFLMRPEPLIVTKSNLRSRIHRRAYADYIGVKRYGTDGKLVGELRFVGLFTSTAYTRSVLTIPFLRRKVEGIIRRAGFSPDSHSGKALVNVLEILSARRTVPGRRGDPVLLRHDDHGARRPAAGARSGTPRQVRPLRLGPRLRSARPLRQRRPPADRRLPRRGL